MTRESSRRSSQDAGRPRSEITSSPASFSFAYNIAVALFGGFTPAISMFLIHETGNAAIGGVWLSIAAACSLAAALLIKLPVEMAVTVRPAIGSAA